QSLLREHECGLAALQRAFGFLHGRFEWAFFYAIERIALLHDGALAEKNGFQIAFHARSHFDAIDRFDASDEFRSLGDLLSFGLDRTHRNCRRRGDLRFCRNSDDTKQYGSADRQSHLSSCHTGTQVGGLERGHSAIDYNNFCRIASKPKYISLFIWLG